MFPQSRTWQMITAFGHGMIFTLALTGAVRIASSMAGTELTSQESSNFFALSSLIAGPVAVAIRLLVNHRRATA